MSPGLSFVVSALVLLFLLQGLGALFAVLFGAVSLALLPATDPAAFALVVLPVAALLAPALPFSRWLDRRRTLAGAATVAAAARILLCLPGYPVRLAAALVVVAAGFVFLSKAVGLLDGRSVAAGLAAAVALDCVLRLAGWSYDPTLRASWLPAQVVVSGAIALLAFRLLRGAGPETHEAGSLERRAGGMRLRGALALGCILSLELNANGNAAAMSRWSHASYGAVATAMTAGAALAMLALLHGTAPSSRSRLLTLALVVLATAGAVLPPLVTLAATPALLLAVAAQASLLLLLALALTPAGGRRRGWNVAAGNLLMLIVVSLYLASYVDAFEYIAPRGGGPWVLLSAGAVLGALCALIPRPAEHPPRPHSRASALAVAGALAFVAVALGFTLLRPAPAAVARVNRDVRIATFNVNHGYDASWRYDPERIARTIEANRPDLVALQEVPAGLLFAYGTDLALWLGRRLDLVALPAPSVGGLLGDAVLTRLPVERFERVPIPPDAVDPMQLAHVRLSTQGGPMDLYAIQPGGRAEARRSALAAALARVAEGPAVLTGDLDAADANMIASSMRAHGFADALALGGFAAPAFVRAQRIDRIWVRGYDVVEAGIPAGGGSDHRMVTATLRLHEPH